MSEAFAGLMGSRQFGLLVNVTVCGIYVITYALNVGSAEITYIFRATGNMVVMKARIEMQNG